MIAATGLRKVYRTSDGKLIALDGVSLRVGAGECVAVVGPSGSGKSTLLHALGALARPTTGRVVIDGVSAYELSPADRVVLRREKIGFVFQTFHLIPYLTAEENVRVALALRGLPRHETRTEAARLLGQVGLSKCADHVPDELSVGERQRVALARAIAGSPKAVLADEPTGNLDPATAEEVCRYLRGFCDEGAAVIIVTHDPLVARTADRTLRIEAGRIVREDVS